MGKRKTNKRISIRKKRTHKNKKRYMNCVTDEVKQIIYLMKELK